MKAFDLFNLHETFTRMLATQEFTPEQKLVVGREMLASLPAAPFCASTPETHRFITEAMSSALEKLDAASKPAEGPQAQPSEPAEVAASQPKKPRNKPVHQAPAVA